MIIFSMLLSLNVVNNLITNSTMHKMLQLYFTLVMPFICPLMFVFVLCLYIIYWVFCVTVPNNLNFWNIECWIYLLIFICWTHSKIKSLEVLVTRKQSCCQYRLKVLPVSSANENTASFRCFTGKYKYAVSITSHNHVIISVSLIIFLYLDRNWDHFPLILQILSVVLFCLYCVGTCVVHVVLF